MNKFILFLLGTFIPVFAVAQQTDTLTSEVSLRTYAEKLIVPQNEEVIYYLELSWYGTLDRYVISEIADPVTSNLNLRSSGSTNRVTTENGQTKSYRIITYYYTPIEIGMAYIDAASVTYLDALDGSKETLFSQRISIEVSEPVITAKEEFMPGTIILWLFIFVFAAALVYFVIRYLQRRGQNSEEEKELTLEEKYLELLKETIHLSNGANNENLSDLSKLFNSYIAEKFSIPGLISKSIVIDRLKNLSVDDKHITNIEEMINQAELVRFARVSIEETELHRFFDSIEYILNSLNKNESNQNIS